MQDFIRIRGEVISSPLNENFRRLLNQISISNTNLIFPEENAIVETLDDMRDIKEPLDAQTCYVVSSGELYRYTKKTNEWLKIMDIGQTFRQGFLNSGAVVLEDKIKLKTGSETILQMPNMLVYFKNKPGDNRYLKGMYLIKAQELDVAPYTSAAGAYSIFVDEKQIYSINIGMPTTDNPGSVYIGSFVVDKTAGIREDFIYTLPDIAYTAERGHFFIDGGRASGLDLAPGSGKKVGRKEGFYYDEGVNFTIGQTANFPADTDNGSNFNLKLFEAQSEITDLYYAYPVDTINNGFDLIESNELVIDKYYNPETKALDTVESGSFTIQHHLVTPNGQNIMIYGSVVYNSFVDAQANLNTPLAIDADFPYTEVTRVIVGNVPGFDSAQSTDCEFFVMERLAQVGTITPVFADNVFTLYSGEEKDDVPSQVQFSLKQLQATNFDNLYTLNIKKDQDTEYLFALDKKYLFGHNDATEGATMTLEDKIVSKPYTNKVDGIYGYTIPTEHDIVTLRQRIDSIETELWNVPDVKATLETLEQNIVNQSVRFRLYDLERRTGLAETNITNNKKAIDNLQLVKVDKTTTVNGYALGNIDNNEVEHITLVTGDILEGVGKDNKPKNLWYTEARVSKNADVQKATEHIGKLGSGTKTDKNIHGLSTDDLTIGTNKFVTQNDLNKLANVPANTNNELNKKLESITIQSLTGKASTTLGQVDTIAVNTFGAKISVDEANRIATLECVGQLNPDDFMTKQDYAHTSINDPSKFGYVEKALEADNLTAVVEGGPNQYYGTDATGEVGVYDLPKWVDTEDPEHDLTADVESVMFQPVPHSVTLKHLANSKVLYTTENEESELNTNVYDLVKNHYHKVYNDAVQGPYSNGNTEPVEATIYYAYTVPAGGLKGQTYQFACGNDLYEFAGTTAMTVGMILQFNPKTKTLVYGKLKNNTAYTIENPVTVTVNPIEVEDVNEELWLNFTTQTDWNKVNEWNFGTGLSVQVLNGRATINAVSPSSSSVRQFSSLEDVSVTYDEQNIGKLLQLAREESGVYKIVLTSAPPLHLYMTKDKYAYNDTKVIRAVDADSADTATTADKLQNKYTANDAGTSDSTLWSAVKIKSNTSAQIKSEGVNTYSGTAVPTNDIGKDGDLYILLED